MAAATIFVLLARQVPAPTAHAFQAIVFVIFGYAALHAAIGAVFGGMGCGAGAQASSRPAAASIFASARSGTTMPPSPASSRSAP